jgi:5'-nucleotidase
MAAALSGWSDLVVAAPSKDMSGSGTGIGAFDPVVGVALDAVDLEGVPGYTIAGPPGLAVMAAALGAFGRMPDLVVSGINAGMNTGHSIIHSGTVGAALTARTFRSKGLAVSLARSDPWLWDTAASVGVATAKWMLGGPDRPTVLNVNVPAVSIEEVEGIHWADLDDFGYFHVANADVTDHKLQFVVGSPSAGIDPASDTALCQKNFVTLTPLTTVEPAPFPNVDASSIWHP